MKKILILFLLLLLVSCSDSWVQNDSINEFAPINNEENQISEDKYDQGSRIKIPKDDGPGL